MKRWVTVVGWVGALWVSGCGVQDPGDGDADAGSGGTAAVDGDAGTGGAAADDGVPGDAGASSGGSSATGGSASGGDSGSATGGAPPVLVPLTVFVAGDSTVSTYADTASPGDQAGWGQMLGALFRDYVTVDNHAVGGRTSRRFIQEGRLEAIWADAAAGDYLLVQFGTNDSNKSATYVLGDTTYPYYLAPATDFKTQLGIYITQARAHGVVPVFVTPPPRNSAYCTGGNGTGAYAQAMRELGQAEGVTVLDLNAQAVAYLKAICPSPTPEDFFLRRADGTVDGTHFQENGARKLAGFIAAELAASTDPLRFYLE